MWSHQIEAVDAIETALSAGGRATVVMACGTGKTRVAAETIDRLAKHGRALVVVPTIELLHQTISEHRGTSPGADTRTWIAVCSSPYSGPIPDSSAIDSLRSEGVPITTDPDVLGQLLGDAPATVVTTYQSLPTITALTTGPWDLMVVDEAHRAAGAAGAPWGALHHDTAIPARRRLYMTATPRIYGSDLEAASMDDESVFGPEVYRLPFADAIDAGLLADYRLVIGVVTEAEVAQHTEAASVIGIDGQAIPARTLATQIAMIRAIDEYGLRRLISFHASIAISKRFTATLPNAIDLVDRAPGARRILARHINGKTDPETRRAVLDQLADAGDRTVCVSNCRVLGEGVNVPTLDGVVFADPKESVIDIVQAVGRALRRGQDSGKVATILVPVLVGADEEPDAAMNGSEWSTVWKVVKALRAHDERIARDLDNKRTTIALEGIPTGEQSPWWEFSGPSVDADWAKAIGLRLIDMGTSRWLDGYAAALRLHQEHGHIDVPASYIDATGYQLGTWLAHRRTEYRQGRLGADRVALLEALNMVWEPSAATWQQNYLAAQQWHAVHGNLEVRQNDDGVLHNWLYRQRHLNRSGDLSEEQVSALEELGIDWEPERWTDRRWREGIAACRSYAAEHGRLSPAKSERHGQFPIGSWVNSRRIEYRKGTLVGWKAAELEALGIVWEPKRERWDRGMAAATDYFRAHGHLRVPDSYVTKDGFNLGKWVAWCRSRRRGTKANQSISAEQIAALDAIGMVWQVQPRHATTRQD